MKLLNLIVKGITEEFPCLEERCKKVLRCYRYGLYTSSDALKALEEAYWNEVMKNNQI